MKQPEGTKRVVLLITPQTHVRTTKADKKWFRIPEDILIEKYQDGYKRKKRILRYFQYKKALREEAARVGFQIPNDGAWIRFHLPMPPSWSKKKKFRMEFQPHQSRPDASNLHKAFEDALREDDMKIWDYRVTKLWYNSVKGFIECFIPDIDSVQIDMAAIEAMQMQRRVVNQDQIPVSDEEILTSIEKKKHSHVR